MEGHVYLFFLNFATRLSRIGQNVDPILVKLCLVDPRLSNVNTMQKPINNLYIAQRYLYQL
jgi:hypothetical protein